MQREEVWQRLLCRPVQTSCDTEDCGFNLIKDLKSNQLFSKPRCNMDHENHIQHVLNIWGMTRLGDAAESQRHVHPRWSSASPSGRASPTGRSARSRRSYVPAPRRQLCCSSAAGMQQQCCETPVLAAPQNTAEVRRECGSGGVRHLWLQGRRRLSHPDGVGPPEGPPEGPAARTPRGMTESGSAAPAAPRPGALWSR